MEARSLVERVIKEMGISAPAGVPFSDTLLISDDLQIDSLQFILFVLKIEKAAGRKLFTADKVGKIRTVGDICRLIESGAAG